MTSEKDRKGRTTVRLFFFVENSSKLSEGVKGVAQFVLNTEPFGPVAEVASVEVGRLLFDDARRIVEVSISSNLQFH